MIFTYHLIANRLVKIIDVLIKGTLMQIWKSPYLIVFI